MLNYFTDYSFPIHLAIRCIASRQSSCSPKAVRRM